jgi:hypothetical protein
VTVRLSKGDTIQVEKSLMEPYRLQLIKDKLNGNTILRVPYMGTEWYGVSLNIY